MKLQILAALAICATASGAEAKARLVVSIQQTKEVTESTPAGKVTRFVPSSSASPGDVLEYVLVYTNQGDEPATNAVIEDQVPQGTRFIANSAAGDGAEITFSSDKGKSYATAVKLTYEVKLPSGAVERRVATPSEYTNIRWTIPRVAAGATGRVSFRVRVN